MRKGLTWLLAFYLSLLFTASAAMAGVRHHRFYDFGYRPYLHHHHHPFRHRYTTNVWIPAVGVGLVTGALVGSLVAAPPPRTVYLPSAGVAVFSPPGSPPPPLVQQPEMVLRQVTVTEKLVNLRSGPGLDTAILGRAVAGQVVDVIGAAPEWLYVRTGSRQYGWIMSRYTTETASPVG